MKLVSWPALCVALVCWVVVYAVLVNATGDGEDITATWLLFGFPGIFIIHAWHGWAAIPFNAALLYITLAYLIPGFIRAYRKYSRAPE